MMNFTLISILSTALVTVIIMIFYELWWVPNRVRRLMGSQGIRGPPGGLVNGCTKEMMRMRNEAMSLGPLEILSNDLVPRLQPHILSWTKIYGSRYIQWFGRQAQLVITEPGLIKEVLNSRDGVFEKPIPSVFIKMILGDGLGSSRGEKWAKMRRLANHAFQGECLKSMIPAMIASAKTMVERWERLNGEEIEVHKEFKLLTSEVISRTAFGSSYLEGKTIFELLDKLTLIASQNIFKPSFPIISKIFKSSKVVESEKLMNTIHKSIKDIIKNREDIVINGEEDDFGDYFLGVLLKAHHNSDIKHRISIDEIIDECKTLYFAGQETTSNLLTWAAFLLANNTFWQDEARKEVHNVFGKQIPKPDEISKLKILGMIINESLRLYPPATGIVRRVERETKLGDLNLPRGIMIYIPILLIQHDPKLWGDDASLFKPERFAEGVAKATNNNIGAFIPFALGPRSCVGFNFAIIEAKIALAMILQRFIFTLSPAYVHSPIQILNITPQHGVQIILNRF